MKIQRDNNPVLFFSRKERGRILSATQTAEMQTSGEIRVHLERKLRGETDQERFNHAKEIFERLGMTNTKDHNGVLILLGLKSKRFFVLGDKGIDEKVPPGFWDEIVKQLSKQFREDRFAEGIEEGILKIGEKLKAYFPYQRDDINELPDEISFSR